jgi:hypothetical protein
MGVGYRQRRMMTRALGGALVADAADNAVKMLASIKIMAGEVPGHDAIDLK